MKYKYLISILVITLSNLISAQNSITYNTETGNYDIIVNNEDTSYTAIYEPATKVEPTINASVSTCENGYKFEYSVTNGDSGKQRLLSILVEYFSIFDNRTRPNNEWYMGKYSNYPVLSWGHAFADPTGIWVPTTGIEQGSTVSGFSFESSGLPAIVNSYFKGLVAFGLSCEPPPDIDAYIDSISVFQRNSVIRKTIGPKDPPGKFKAVDFADTLISYTNQSYNLEWISDEKTRDNYLDSFDAIKSYIEEEDFENAIKALEDVMEMADEDLSIKGTKPEGNISLYGSITTEAYALIYYNSEYLIKRLEEQKIKGLRN